MSNEVLALKSNRLFNLQEVELIKSSLLSVISCIENHGTHVPHNMKTLCKKVSSLQEILLEESKIGRSGHHARDATRLYCNWTNNKHKGRLCNDWLDFKNFWNDVVEIPDGMYLARLDVTKPFSKDNFYFSDRKQYK